MGTTVSTLVLLARLARTVTSTFVNLVRDYLAIRQQAGKPAPLPQPADMISSTQPYWLRDPPHPGLVAIRSKAFPEEADVVIIGSGIAGAAVAHSALNGPSRLRLHYEAELVKEAMDSPLAKGGGGAAASGGRAAAAAVRDDEEQPPEPVATPRVVVLEARTLCSGATGRNGGHIKASPHDLFARLVRAGFPPERAAALVRFQLLHMPTLGRLCSHGSESDGFPAAEYREVETVDLYMAGRDFEAARRDVELLRRWVSEVEVNVWDKVQAQQNFDASEHVIGAISYKAAAVWPYRLVSAVWRNLLREHKGNISIETYTQAMSIRVDDGSGAQFPYLISTPRGVIRARHVVHATNAYTSHLVPKLAGKIVGILAHMTAQRPTAQKLKHGVYGGKRSWSVMYGGAAEYDYITQRPGDPPVTGGEEEWGVVGGGNDPSRAPRDETGDLMVGGGFARSRGRGSDMVGVYDDSILEPMTTAHLAGILRAAFRPGSVQDLRLDSTWTGVICVTGDQLPLVGRLDERITGRKTTKTTSTAKGSKDAARDDAVSPGEWIAAGFNGDGMVWAWLCGVAVGRMLTGGGIEELDFVERSGYPAGKMVDWLPPELLATYDRVQKMDVTALAKELL